MSLPIHAVCFDLDDTLYPYARYARAGLDAAADYIETETGGRYHEELRDIYFESGITEGTFGVLVARHDLDNGLVARAVEAFHSSTTPLEPYPETEAVLAELGEAYRLGLITDGRGGHAKLDRLGLTHHFDDVVVTPKIDSSKQDRRVFERMFDSLSVLPWSTVYVGDDPRVDFRVPNAFGMTTVRLRRGRYADIEPPDERSEPDAEIRSLDELPATIDASDDESAASGSEIGGKP
ncbi:HAD family hydrolase [Halonotius terrestris]|uniref:HAD family hydrolase n=1 Tax=Halonotius terrestris TaxID=2487750 RepID=A0A8J8P839_9EURY|nr:HAD family hydrolase [Halonotius terrestris]TQQ79320.1 HAD family hydrolase [Halonotius terrestris]